MLKSSCRYQIDAQDRLVSVQGAWSLFAMENGGKKLLEDSPLGQPIWNFIEGRSTRYIYKILIQQVREICQSVQFPFRADSPDELRYMDMEITPGVDNCVWFQTSISRVLDRASLTDDIIRSPARNAFFEICAWCNKVQVGAEWVSLVDAIWMLGLFDKPKAPPVSHGICPDCVKVLRREVYAVNA